MLGRGSGLHLRGPAALSQQLARQEAGGGTSPEPATHFRIDIDRRHIGASSSEYPVTDNGRRGAPATRSEGDMKSTSQVSQTSARERCGERAPEPGLNHSSSFPPYAKRRTLVPGDATRRAQHVRVCPRTRDHGRTTHVSTRRAFVRHRLHHGDPLESAGRCGHQDRGPRSPSAVAQRWAHRACRRRRVSRRRPEGVIQQDQGVGHTILPASAVPVGAAGSALAPHRFRARVQRLHTTRPGGNHLSSMSRSLLPLGPWVHLPKRVRDAVPGQLLGQYIPTGKRILSPDTGACS